MREDNLVPKALYIYMAQRCFIVLCTNMAAVTSCNDLRLLSLLQYLSAAVISAWRKDEMRTKLKAVKKLVDDADRAKKNAMMQQVNEYRPIYF